MRFWREKFGDDWMNDEIFNDSWFLILWNVIIKKHGVRED